MAFDFISFGTGLAAGALVGILAGYLHETETIGELQERVRTALLQFERLMSDRGPERSSESVDPELEKQLLELQEEIKQLYKKPGR